MYVPRFTIYNTLNECKLKELQSAWESHHERGSDNSLGLQLLKVLDHLKVKLLASLPHLKTFSRGSGN